MSFDYFTLKEIAFFYGKEAHLLNTRHNIHLETFQTTNEFIQSETRLNDNIRTLQIQVTPISLIPSDSCARSNGIIISMT